MCQVAVYPIEHVLTCSYKHPPVFIHRCNNISTKNKSHKENESNTNRPV